VARKAAERHSQPHRGSGEEIRRRSEAVRPGRRFTGGAFAGFATDCEFLPGSRESWADHYGCFATRSYQNYNRVCSVSEDWATYSVYETRTVADVVDGKLKTVATCSVGGFSGDSACPDGSDTEARWNLQPKADKSGASAAPSPLKVDAEAGGAEDDQPWLRACLTDTGYPAADPASDGSRK
jgi:hypothetical protein